MASGAFTNAASIEAENALYTPLIGSKATRLFTLLPGESSEPIKCELRCEPDIRNAPTYHAISYCWGNAEDTNSVICNDRELKITNNLHDALNVLRSRSGSLTLWADAICINQNDTEERNHQVSFMNTIFSYATRVHVWLGWSVKDELTLAAAEIRRVTDEMFSAVYGEQSRASWLQMATEEEAISLILSHDARLSCTSSECWQKVMPLYFCSWFSRIWVIQEISTCRDVEMLFDEGCVEWIRVALVAKWRGLTCRRHDLDVVGRADKSSWEWAEFMAKKQLRARPHVPFLEVLHHARRFEATDLRDKVYALLNYRVSKDEKDDDMLSHPSFREVLTPHLSIHPNYTKPVAEVFLDVAARAIRQSRKLEVLTYSRLRRHTDFFGCTWVPDWDMNILEIFRPLPTWLYSASRSLSCNEPTPDGSLVLEGLLLGQIDLAAPTLALMNVECHTRSSLKTVTIGCSTAFARLITQDCGHQQRFSTNVNKTPREQREVLPVLRHLAAWLLHIIPEAMDVSQGIHLPLNFWCCDFCNALLVQRNRPTGLPTQIIHCKTCLDRDEFVSDVNPCETCYRLGIPCHDESHDVHFEETFGIWVPPSMLSREWLQEHGRGGDASICLDLPVLNRKKRIWFSTSGGLVGNGRNVTQEGDVVVVLFGASVPFVLRPFGSKYKIVGECYVDKMMDGEAIDMWHNGELKSQFFEMA